MGLAHSCPDGRHSKLVRTGPVGTMEGVAFRCPRCGHEKSGTAIMAEFEAFRPTLIARLAR